MNLLMTVIVGEFIFCILFIGVCEMFSVTDNKIYNL